VLTVVEDHCPGVEARKQIQWRQRSRQDTKRGDFVCY
jgi:hypothetical protein